ncbi:hypothetical protein D0Z07_5529 [Hyphodiscus hymeniophilus]|uniref:Heterokaryon incompatibility domain-containing protein n=1 Tax=Hyphodiscus hymeniophilus TaxID=353542 RepID=A0A9P7AW47_9HELO|nr:hypothetical protein D0Z07_5529 [Hyphodiscus hymeniophilus]
MDHLQCGIGHNIQVRLLESGDHFDPKNAEHKFHSYPAIAGWIYDETENKFSVNKDFNGEHINFGAFLQSWLFFGLIATVVRIGQLDSFSSRDFIDDRLGKYVHTKGLNQRLEAWQIEEHSMKEGMVFRMVRAQAALAKARRIVLEYCSYNQEQELPPDDVYFVDSKVALSLMVLGETLGAAKEKIVQNAALSHIRGWYGDVNEGWGTPRLIIDKMKADKWCRKTVHTLKGQMGSHATSFLAAWAAHEDPRIHFQGHKECTEDACAYKSEDGSKKYQTIHNKRYCTDPSTCRLRGPDISELVAILDKEEDNIPLLELKVITQGQTIRIDDVKVVSHKAHTKYATFSHVWSDGYGNETTNELRDCQLLFFYHLMHHDKIEKSKDIPFYIDTLAVPVAEEFKPQRLKAIRRIYEIFHNAAYTIVIDNGLSRMSPGKGYEMVAMKILASGWMRRLWTLEEAYLSKKLMINFDGAELVDVDENIEGGYPEAQDALSSNIANLAQGYFHNLMGPQRRRRRAGDNGRGGTAGGIEGVGLLASVWQASRWRTTAHAKHETLALATLLNLKNYSDLIAEAGALPNETDPIELRLEELMRDLWKALSVHLDEGIIPPSIIFVPGKRLSMPGFGWAPKSWMVGHGDDGGYPDPARIPSSPAKLMPDGRGLLVKFPGFILHAKDRNSVLRQNREEFTFPRDNTLLDWYTVNISVDGVEDIAFYRGEHHERKLAIILSGPRPQATPEIALLVELIEPKWRTNDVWYVSWNRRVLIRRETRERLINKNYIIDSEGQEESLICGEVVDDNQKWCVDGRRAMPEMRPPEEQPPATLATEKSPEPGIAVLDRIPMLLRSTISGFNPWGRRRPQGVQDEAATAIADSAPQRAKTFQQEPRPQELRAASTWAAGSRK